MSLNYETVVSATDLLAIVKDNMPTACAHRHLVFKGERMPLLNCLWTHLQVPSGDSSWLIAVICSFLEFFSFNFNSFFYIFLVRFTRVFRVEEARQQIAYRLTLKHPQFAHNVCSTQVLDN